MSDLESQLLRLSRRVTGDALFREALEGSGALTGTTRSGSRYQIFFKEAAVTQQREARSANGMVYTVYPATVSINGESAIDRYVGYDFATGTLHVADGHLSHVRTSTTVTFSTATSTA